MKRSALAAIFQAQFTAHRKLDHGNPNLENLKADFKRFGFTLDLTGADPANPLRLEHLAKLNEWRNVAAHQGTPTATAGPLTHVLVAIWHTSCEGLVNSLDGIMYNQLRRILRRCAVVTCDERVFGMSKQKTASGIPGGRLRHHSRHHLPRRSHRRGPGSPGSWWCANISRPHSR